jgi:hypothetical protein
VWPVPIEDGLVPCGPIRPRDGRYARFLNTAAYWSVSNRDLGKLALSDYACEGAPLSFIMKGNGDGDGCVRHPPLHDFMTAALTDRYESMLLQNPAHLVPREDAKLTQPEPQFV